MPMNPEIYNQAYQGALRMLQQHQEAETQRQKRIKQAQGLGEQIYNSYQSNLANAAQAAPSLVAPVSAASTVPQIAAAGQPVYSTLMGATSLGAAGTGAATSAAGPTIAAATEGASAAGSATSSAAAGTTSAAGSSFSGPLAGAALAISIASSQPGSWMFPIKKALFNVNEQIQTSPLGALSGLQLGPTPVYEAMKKNFSWIFGDPNEQERTRSQDIARSRALKAMSSISTRQRASLMSGEEPE